MIAVVILYIISILGLGVLGTLFYFLDKRQQALMTTFGEITAKQTELEEKMVLFDENQKTLRANDDILAKDIETLLHEFKGIQKKVRKVQHDQS